MSTRSATRSPLPIPPPGKIICIGLNYRDHAHEAGAELPKAPLLFAKWPSSLTGPGAPIVLPGSCREVDYEAELAVLIGRSGRDIPESAALTHLAGYMCLNDVSARDVQFADGQWTRGKSFDTFCPIGPRLIPAEEVSDPQRLRVRCLLNGELVQDGTTAEMVFGVAEIIAYASRDLTLEEGDLIATGTPAGVGWARTPQRFLAHGDTVVVDVEDVGVLSNPVVHREAAEPGGGCDTDES